MTLYWTSTSSWFCHQCHSLFSFTPRLTYPAFYYKKRKAAPSLLPSCKSITTTHAKSNHAILLPRQIQLVREQPGQVCVSGERARLNKIATDILPAKKYHVQKHQQQIQSVYENLVRDDIAVPPLNVLYCSDNAPDKNKHRTAKKREKNHLPVMNLWRSVSCGLGLQSGLFEHSVLE